MGGDSGVPLPPRRVSQQAGVAECWAPSCPCSDTQLGWDFHFCKLGKPKSQQSSSGTSRVAPVHQLQHLRALNPAPVQLLEGL